MSFLRFVGSSRGRVVRVVGGLLLMTFGLSGDGRRKVLAVAGVVPLAAGAFDVCLLGPLFRLPFGGKAFRARTVTT